MHSMGVSLLRASHVEIEESSDDMVLTYCPEMISTGSVKRLPSSAQASYTLPVCASFQLRTYFEVYIIERDQVQA